MTIEQVIALREMASTLDDTGFPGTNLISDSILSALAEIDRLTARERVLTEGVRAYNALCWDVPVTQEEAQKDEDAMQAAFALVKGTI